ncbi:hypothetical protein F4560_001047 [Saccharothrix ecbatanensis]|uniref:Uncharacterized protein n=1 Tax=Saccharothrix ecbatanensis TaxID=1105145 RepID=A0A7W9HFX9_9PSEU|nr:hypothetical protein [Saccharothrix ecbatanensis]
MQVGRLRDALRDAVLALDDPETRDQHQHAVPVEQART